MAVLVIGANGKVGQRAVPLLVEAGHRVRAMIRDSGQASAVEERGAEPVVADLEGEFGPALDGCETVVFAAGSGGKTGADKTALVDGLGAILAINAAVERGSRRFVMVSSRGADDPDQSPAIKHYHVAKAIADAYLQRSGLDYTILRPGRLTDEPATGHIHIGPHLGQGAITRADVAATVVACLELENTIGKTFGLLNDGEPIRDVLQSL